MGSRPAEEDHPWVFLDLTYVHGHAHAHEPAYEPAREPDARTARKPIHEPDTKPAHEPAHEPALPSWDSRWGCATRRGYGGRGRSPGDGRSRRAIGWRGRADVRRG